MDIDSPPAPFANPDPHAGHNHLILPAFSASFPLPFRVLFLIGLAQLLWAVNLHVLWLLGMDTAWILDIRDPALVDVDREGVEEGELELDHLALELEPNTTSHHPRNKDPGGAGSTSRPESGKLYQPVYKLFAIYSGWVGGGWCLMRILTGGGRDEMESWRGLIGVVMMGVVLGVVIPWRGPGERERMALRRVVKRIFLPPLRDPIFFTDIILADILTSFAKVLGDLWISGCQVWKGGITQGRVAQSGWSLWITLGMVCLPYTLRFRQCLLEYHQSSYTSPRPLANALKYFSAFPVILLSAAQKNVITDIASSKGISVQELGNTGERWFGEHRLFRLWLLAVVINSMFSFYWDIEMDWGLALCEVDTWLGPSRSTVNGGNGMLGTSSPRMGRRVSDQGVWIRAKRLLGRGPAAAHQRSPCPTPVSSFQAQLPLSPEAGLITNPQSYRFFAFGLRPTLLLPDPLVYHLFAIIDIVLRFTWSLKLSSHLHTISEIESGVFMMEALELVRRWMWVFVRIEWEAVKKNEMQRFSRSSGDGRVIWQGEDKE